MELDEHFKYIKNKFDSKQKEVETINNLLNDRNYEVRELKNKISIIENDYIILKNNWENLLKLINNVTGKVNDLNKK